MKKEHHSRFLEVTSRVSFCSEKAIEINGQTFVADPYNAYVEFFLSHAFPVVTCDNTAIHPQVVANSYHTMRGKVFDLAHIIRSYNPREYPRDRVLGTIMEVEFPQAPAGGWKVQADRTKAPGIRAVAVMHKQLEGVKQILTGYANRSANWTVSMEQDYFEEETGFLVRGEKGVEDFASSTPDDLAKLGFVYVPFGDAPRKLKITFNPDESRIEQSFNDQPVVILFGGLDKSVFYKGTGLTPEGKEDAARVSQMLASRTGIRPGINLIDPLESTLRLGQSLRETN
ncbi:MAG TPA: hypothetical protein VGY56_17435 [Verrucomicrobiae bacterium]|nr:hypothetical protein [Verrucomicrobiae bacterium]